MESEVYLVFPHQLFSQLSIESVPEVWLVEEYLFFRQLPFHPLKLVFHRASMKAFAEFLQKQGINVFYVDSGKPGSDVRKLPEVLHQRNIRRVHIYQLMDHWLEKRLHRGLSAYDISFTQHPNPGFLGAWPELENTLRNGSYFQTSFYQQHRKRLGLLMDDHGKPLGGRWSFDQENRKRWPKGRTVPPIMFPPADEYWQEATRYVKDHFGTDLNLGNTPVYPHTHAQAQEWLDDFLSSRWVGFGTWQDAIVSGQSFLHHSLLSVLLNTGLLTPHLVLERAMSYASEREIPLNDVEGFMRQIIGWREFVAAVYLKEGIAQRTRNFWNFTRPMPQSFYEGRTGLLPFDEAFKRLKKTAYSHHIERLMIFGNLMLLCEIHPDEVYRWFMQHFIDAYDWVMVPNVYGMSQYADGGLLTTKPYISASTYLLRMSDYPGGSWTEIWDGLFWRFLNKHRNFFVQNPRMGILIKTFDQMPVERQHFLLNRADNYLGTL
ncbi:MAG: cryptochrome/photolyase family protein [Bacteroidales bacterium]